MKVSFFTHVLFHFWFEEAIELRIFLDFLLPCRSLEIFIHLYDVLEIIESEFSGTHVQNKLR